MFICTGQTLQYEIHYQNVERNSQKTLYEIKTGIGVLNSKSKELFLVKVACTKPSNFISSFQLENLIKTRKPHFTEIPP